MANIVGLVGGCVTTLSGVPQIYHHTRNKSYRVDNAFNVGDWIVNDGIFSQQIPVWLPSTISLGMTISMMGIKYVYENQASYQSYTEV